MILGRSIDSIKRLNGGPTSHIDSPVNAHLGHTNDCRHPHGQMLCPRWLDGEALLVGTGGSGIQELPSNVTRRWNCALDLLVREEDSIPMHGVDALCRINMQAPAGRMQAA